MKRLLIAIFLLLSLILCSCGAPEPTPTQPANTQPAVGHMLVHYLDVGQADCALLECDGQYILIDGGNVEDSSMVVSYLEKAGVSELAAVFCSHAHEDHVGGLPGVLAVYPTGAVYAPTRTYSSNCFDDFLYYTDQQGLEVTIPSVGDVITFGDATVEVLGPVKTYAETNDTSLVLAVTYGDTRFLFTGDMETTAETDLIESGAALYADVLKVGHHGSDTSTGYRFLREVMPTHAIVSVGEGNSYDHPNEKTLSLLSDAGATVYRTDKLGHIIAISNGTNVTVSWTSSAAPEPPEDAEITYIGNKNSKKLHLESCGNLPKEENRVYFEDYDEAMAEGYLPCGQCMP